MDEIGTPLERTAPAAAPTATPAPAAGSGAAQHGSAWQRSTQQGSTRQRSARWWSAGWTAALVALAVALDRSAPATFHEPLLLRWLRAVAEHPARTWVALLLARHGAGLLSVERKWEPNDRLPTSK